MTANLFDVNFLVALAWPNHLSHGEAVRWFKEHPHESFATCPITESGFVRISLNPLIVGEHMQAATVLDLLRRYRKLANHVFWPDDLPPVEALSPFALLSGHRQVTDAYLLALAAAKGGRLVTFDRAIAEAAPEALRAALILV